ncbi:MAG: type II toxin-antitoxin system VapC family toxin [Pseudolabrys sp.]
MLDTNVVSELWRPRPDHAVRFWLDTQEPHALFICTPVLAELHFGAERLAKGKRKEILHGLITQVEVSGFKERILPFDMASASTFGRIGAQRERAGRRMEPVDAMIAAIALTNGLKLATRDTSGFADIGLEVVNPFEAVVAR